MSQITIIGGGLAGLTAAVACAEAGAEVVVHEAHATLGGRARTSEPPWLAHEGPHAFYADGPHWHWLVERDLVGPVATLPLREVRGDLVPPRRAPAPDAAGEPAAAARPPAPPRPGGRRLPHLGRRAARRGGGAGRGATCWAWSPTTPIPGRLSAAFVWDLLLRVTAPRAPAVRWPVGGWPSVVDRLAARARELGVRIETSSRVDALPEPPVIVATQLESARALLGDDDAGLGERAVRAARRGARGRPAATRSSSSTSTTRGSSSASPASTPRSRRPGTRSCRPTCR